MAANEFSSDRPSSRYSRQNSDLPRPRLPPPSPSYSAYKPSDAETVVSPITDLFDEPTYPAYNQRSQQGLEAGSMYHGARGLGGRDASLYADDIPLRPRPPPKDSEDRTGQHPRHGYSNENRKFVGSAKQRDPESRQRRKLSGMFRGKIPWVVYILTLIQVSVFIAELAKNGVLTQTPIEIHPQFNPMIGPSIYVLINMGARYVPCMRSTPGIQNSTVPVNWPCPNTTSSDAASPMNHCTLSELCGFGGVPNPQTAPNQWFRFIIPMFLHAGIIHISFNMLLQMLLGREMEKLIGSVRFALVYFSSGIFGFIMGGNFAPSGIASTGASGALFGVIALMLLDLLYTWRERESPVKDLVWIALDIVIAFVLGLLPGLDNFAHIGGFLMGLVLGLCILHSPNALRQRVGTVDLPYSPINTAHKPDVSGDSGVEGFVKQPGEFFKNRKPMWWGWWLVRVGALAAVLVCFIVLLNNFYKSHPTTCSWCKYLSCLPVKNWCDVGNIQLLNTTTTNKRDLYSSVAPVGLSAFF